VPPIETVQVFTEPLLIVPRLTFVEDQTVIPTTSAGEPVVVKVVPEHDAVIANGAAALQFVVALLFQVADPPAQYLSAIYFTLYLNH
jgi:hypothetical protein